MLYVPKTIRVDHPLVVMLGWATARKLVGGFGGEILQPAVCFDQDKAARDESIREMRASGSTVQEIAREFRISDRQVRNIVKEIPQVAGNDNIPNTAAA